MDNEDYASLLVGLNDVRGYRAGKREGFVTHAPESNDVRAIRTSSRLTQEGWASNYGFSVTTLRD